MSLWVALSTFFDAQETAVDKHWPGAALIQGKLRWRLQ